MKDPPSSTYRLQLTPTFTLYDAAAVVPYLADLGVSHVYCSPWLQAAPGSTHGYDVVDHRRVNAELGGAEGLAALATACHEHGLGVVLDIVPNHMCVPNPIWDDVRARGRESPFASWFDIDWDAPGDEVVYRRFFTIDSLAGVRVEDPGVFGATHALVLDQVRSGVVDGLRVDHPDGLADPHDYLDRLATETDGAWVVVEKILEDDERLPTEWSCAGTTGYDALNRVLGLFVDPAGEKPMTEAYAALTGEPADWGEVAAAAKRAAIRSLAPEVERLTRLATRVLEAPFDDIRAAVEALLVATPVYRAYVRPGHPVPEVSRRIVERAAAQPGGELMHRLAEAVLTGPAELVVRFQQTCGPVMAKGIEDTAFYRYLRLVALNEVGGDPGVFGRPVADFHAFCLRLARDWPATMTTLSTHDTKRSEDVRARLAVLSEIPDEWRVVVSEWMGSGPDAASDYLCWQMLVGAWPLTLDRALAYLDKATREAKQRTAWVDGDPEYDAAVRAFVEAVFADAPRLDAVATFVRRLHAAASSNSLSQKLVQLTMPGVPDVYQGCELVDLSLVDPDNRRPVDYETRRRLLASGGDAKLHVVSTALRLRREHPEWFGPAASYEPLYADGPAADHVVAFARGQAAITVATRLPVGLAASGGWRGTTLTLSTGRWVDVLTGASYDSDGAVPLDGVLATSPVALLTPG